MASLSGRTVLITGAARGIGFGTATRFAGTICAWKAKTSRLFGSTSAFTQ